jgi:prophage antirepressor-like protein
MTEFTFQHLRFDFNNVNLRVIGLNGQPWFVAVDVCNVLNGSTTGSTKAWRFQLRSATPLVDIQ